MQGVSREQVGNRKKRISILGAAVGPAVGASVTGTTAVVGGDIVGVGDTGTGMEVGGCVYTGGWIVGENVALGVVLMSYGRYVAVPA